MAHSLTSTEIDYNYHMRDLRADYRHIIRLDMFAAQIKDTDTVTIDGIDYTGLDLRANVGRVVAESLKLLGKSPLKATKGQVELIMAGLHAAPFTIQHEASKVAARTRAYFG